MSDVKIPETIEEALAATAQALGWGHQTCYGKTCGAKIWWGKHLRTGNSVPIDASCGLNHFLTCPDRKQFKRG